MINGICVWSVDVLDRNDYIPQVGKVSEQVQDFIMLIRMVCNLGIISEIFSIQYFATTVGHRSLIPQTQKQWAGVLVNH